MATNSSEGDHSDLHDSIESRRLTINVAAATAIVVTAVASTWSLHGAISSSDTSLRLEFSNMRGEMALELANNRHLIERLSERMNALEKRLESETR